MEMEIEITVPVPNSEPVVINAEVLKACDTANVLREARKANPNCSILNSTIKLKSRRIATQT